MLAGQSRVTQIIDILDRSLICEDQSRSSMGDLCYQSVNDYVEGLSEHTPDGTVCVTRVLTNCSADSITVGRR